MPTTIYFPWEKPYKTNWPLFNWPENTGILPEITSPIASQVSAILDSMNFSFEDITWTKWEKLLSLVCAVFDTTSGITHKTEQKIRDLLKDHHSTFSLFDKSMEQACIRAKKWEKVSVDLYIHDLSNSNFLSVFENIQKQWINPKLLVIGIKSDDCGIIDSRALTNIRHITRLWFEYSLADFVMDGNELKADNLQKFAKEELFPSYIQIAKSVYEKIRKWTIRMWDTVRKLFWVIIKKGIRIFLWNESKEEAPAVDVTKDIELWFLERSTVHMEDILTLEWEQYAQEWLVRFWDGVGVLDGLSRLQKFGLPGLLTDRILRDLIPAITSWKRRSVNVFLKEFWGNDFKMKINEIIKRIPDIHQRKGLIFEILETKYGTLNRRAIENIRFLQDSGFSIAIDDLCVCGSESRMSLEIFDILLEEGIVPDYIKIEWQYCEEIRDGKISEYHLHHLREIVWYCSILPRKPKIILEWIQDTDHAFQVLDALWMADKIDYLFQGRNIKKWNFGVSMGK